MGKANTQKFITLSKYRYMFRRGGRFFLYAPLSNGFAELDEETYMQLEAIGHGSSAALNDDVIDMLRCLKVADVDEDSEVNRHKFNVLSHRFNPANLTLTINPTLAGNFAFPYYFEGTNPSTFMSNEVEDAIVRFVEKHEQARNLNITWFGGEPLLAFDRIVSLTRKLQAIGLNYWAGMITNGYLLTRDKLEQFDNLKIRSVQVTIDGNESMHNSRRFLRSGGDTYDRIVANVESAVEFAPQTRILVRVNVDGTNSNQFFEVFDAFERKKLPNVTVYPAFVSNPTGKGGSDCMYDCDAMAAFLRDAYLTRGYYSQMLFPENITRGCMARNPNSVVIGPEGELYKCWNDVGDATRSYGNINGDINNESVLLDYLVKADYLNNAECNRCIFFTRCDGGCPYERIKKEKEGCNPNDCPMYTRHLEDFLTIRHDYRSKQK